MREAGYTDLERGERGSTEEHLTVTQFKVEKEKERLKELQMEEKYLEDAIDHYQEEVPQSLNQKYWDLKNRFHKLQEDYSYEQERCEGLVFRNNLLEEQNRTMKESIEDYKRVQKFFGSEKIAHAIGFQKQKEAELRRQKRKMSDRGR